MGNYFKPLTVLLLSVMFFTACDNGPSLERVSTRQMATLSGEFYTENPEAIQFPVKVLFAIDCSLSMIVSDPPNPPDEPYGRRIAAIQRFLDRYNTEDYPSVSFSLVLWAGSMIDQTRNGYNQPGFTRSRSELDRVLNNVRNESYTDYLGAMDGIRNIIENDITNVSYQESGESDLARTKYIVCFFSDGMPNTDAGTQLNVDIWQQVEALTQMTEDRQIGQFNFHSFFLSALFRTDEPGDTDGIIDNYLDEWQFAGNTLFGMSTRGNGTFRDVASAAAIDFINIIDMRLTTEYVIKFIVAYNYNVIPGLDELHVDSDCDGLTDEAETAAHGTDPMVYDTDGDGLSDGFEIQVQSVEDGVALWPDPLVNDSGCTPVPGGYWPDQDSDGLTDCEESIKGTYRFVADYDRDGIPDGIEFAMGTNPFQDIYVNDADFDGDLDWFEVQRHTNVLANDPIVRERYGYDYDIMDMGHPDPVLEPDLPQGIRKYGFTISNISILDTQGERDGGYRNLAPGDNFIRLYIAQVPQDRPNAPPVFRMAEVVINAESFTRDVQLMPFDFELID
ncbi:MAG: hypothetical protein JRH15_08860 [Deltaproteobacteria bacterium]|nr:hypothetical protein [Deltaproteobacteria bacterium]